MAAAPGIFGTLLAAGRPEFELSVEPEAARRAWTAIAPHIDTIIDGFYRDIFESRLAPLLHGFSVEQLKNKHVAHWRRAFTGELTDAYLSRMKVMHIAHKEVGLIGTDYAKAYLYLLSKFHTAAVRSASDPADAEELVRTIDAVVGADILRALRTFYDTMIVD